MSEDKVKPTDKWKKVSGGNFWKPDKGDTIIGVLVGLREGQYKRKVFDLQTDKGVITIPSSSVLEGILTEDKLERRFRIDFTGWGKDRAGEETKGAYRNYDVFILEE